MRDQLIHGSTLQRTLYPFASAQLMHAVPNSMEQPSENASMEGVAPATLKLQEAHRIDSSLRPFISWPTSYTKLNEDKPKRSLDPDDGTGPWQAVATELNFSKRATMLECKLATTTMAKIRPISAFKYSLGSIHHPPGHL